MAFKINDDVWVLYTYFGNARFFKGHVREVKADKVKVGFYEDGEFFIKWDWFELSDVIKWTNENNKETTTL